MQDADRHNLEHNSSDPVPPPDLGEHSRSHAAHLGTGGEAHTKPAGNLRHGSPPGELREPPETKGPGGGQR